MTKKMYAIKALVAHETEKGQTQLLKIYTHELVDVALDHPHCRITVLVMKCVVRHGPALRYSKKLTELGFLGERAVGKEMIFIHPKPLLLSRVVV